MNGDDSAQLTVMHMNDMAKYMLEPAYMDICSRNASHVYPIAEGLTVEPAKKQSDAKSTRKVTMVLGIRNPTKKSHRVS